LRVVCSAELVGSGLMIAQAIGLAVKVEDDGAVQQPVQEGCRDGGVAQDFSPRPHWPIGGQNY
jgi:hypothetical protein